MKRHTVCLVMLAAILTLTVSAAADQEVSGTLHRDDTWSGTIQVTGDVYVPWGRTLTILPGTNVLFTPRQDTTPHSQGLHNCPDSKAELIVEGTLRAQGTEDQPILFTSDSLTPSPGDWGGIVLHGCATPVTLSYLVIEYADVNLAAFNLVTIEHCVIRNAYGGLNDCPSAQSWDVRTGLFLHGEGSIVRDCEITDCTWGFHINQGEDTPDEPAIQILGCTIHNNNVTSHGFDVPNGIHVFKSNTHIEGNTIADNIWGIEVGISNVVIIDNAFISNDFGVVIYSPDGPSKGYVYENDAFGNGMDYVRMTPAGPEPMPEDWFQDPYGTSGDSPNGANADTAFTRIVIDGQADDWVDCPILRVDGQGDSRDSGFDLKSVRAFTNDQYLYLLLDAYGDIGEYVQIDLDIDITGDGDREYMATFRPRTGRRDFGDFTSGQGIWNSIEGGDATEREVVELKMPLSLIGGHESFSLGIRVMNGVCCGEQWYTADNVFCGQVSRSDEIELPGSTLAATFDLLPGYAADKVYVPPLQAPNHVAVSPSGVIAITDWGVSDQVFQLHENGSLSTYASPSSGDHFDVLFDSTNNLYVADNSGILWKVTPDGNVSEFARGVLGFQMDIAPNGDIFATGGESNPPIQRITPDGQVSVYTDGLTGPCDLAVSSVTGDVYVLDFGTGILSRANPDGTLTTIISDLIHEWSYIACSPNGDLYYWAHTGSLFLVSTLDRSQTELTWVKHSGANLHPTDFAFDNQGRIVTVDITYNHVVRFDLEAQTGEALWIGMGNGAGLAVAPGGGGLYMTFGHPLSDGHGGVVRIEADGTTTLIVDGLGPDVGGLVFGADGTGYTISTGLIGSEWRSSVYSFDPSGIKMTRAAFPYPGCNLTIDPLTGCLWGLSYGEIWYFDGAWDRYVIPTASVGEHVESLTFTPNGTLYATIITTDMLSIPVEVGLYRVDPAGPIFTLVADLSTVNMCCPLGRIGTGQDGNIYWVGHGDRYTPNNEHDMHMLCITPFGEVSLFGQHLSMDPVAVTGDPDSTDLYFTSGCGVYRVYRP